MIADNYAAFFSSAGGGELSLLACVVCGCSGAGRICVASLPCVIFDVTLGGVVGVVSVSFGISNDIFGVVC